MQLLLLNTDSSHVMTAFMSVLHMYESFGWWRSADYLKVHFAESWNEMHHLLIMEVRLLLRKFLDFFFHSLLKHYPAIVEECLDISPVHVKRIRSLKHVVKLKFL